MSFETTEPDQPSDKRRRGRPPRDHEGQVYRALLSEALVSLEQHPYTSLSVRDLAARAGTNAAMINYYFGGKEGLFLALIEQMFQDIVVRLEMLEQSASPALAHPLQPLANTIMAVYVRWNSVLMLFSSDVALVGKQARHAYRRRLASTVLQAVKRHLASLSQHGHLRSGLDIEVAGVMVSALMTSPFHFSPLINAAGNLSWARGNQQRWRDYVERLLKGTLC